MDCIVAKRTQLYYNISTRKGVLCERRKFMSELLRVRTNSCEETERFAEEWGKTLLGGDVVLLNGELGAGKTHFTKGIARALGVSDVVTSPTFALHNVYPGNTLTLNHFDFYRVEDSDEVEILGLNEYFFDNSGVCVIEWSQNVFNLLPTHRYVVVINKISENEREIIVDKV